MKICDIATVIKKNLGGTEEAAFILARKLKKIGRKNYVE